MTVSIVADTNVLVSALFWEGNESKIMDMVEGGSLRLVTSLPILNELKKVLTHEKFKLDEETANERVEYLLVLADLVSPRRKVNAIKEDPPDNRILECAQEGNVEYVVSGDGHLLKLGKFRKIKIVTARELLGILQSETSKD